MELGNHIKALRQQRGITQETLAAALGVSAQAVSKWENRAAAPDIQLLPAISAYFGVTIDDLFALSDETRMERIQNMLWDERDLDPAAAEREAAFLLEKGRRERSNGSVYRLLAGMENHIACSHRRKAEEYAKEALARTPDSGDAHKELAEAVGIKWPDWYAASHHKIIDWYKSFVEKNPTVWVAYMWLMDALLEDRRFAEAWEYWGKFAEIDHTFRAPEYKGLITWREGDWDGAMRIWEQMCGDYPDDWMTWACVGDALAMAGRYAEAVDHYEKCKQLQKKPRFTDPQAAIAQLKELMGDVPGAIASLEEEIAVLAEDWDTTCGETVDAVRREIEWLKEKREGL